MEAIGVAGYEWYIQELPDGRWRLNDPHHQFVAICHSLYEAQEKAKRLDGQI